MIEKQSIYQALNIQENDDNALKTSVDDLFLVYQNDGEFGFEANKILLSIIGPSATFV